MQRISVGCERLLRIESDSHAFQGVEHKLKFRGHQKVCTVTRIVEEK